MKQLTLGAGLILMLLLTAAAVRALPTVPPQSAAALYNQGNAYARAGKPGMAVLNYERARLLTPGDSDLDANLRTVQTAQHLSVAPASWWARLAMSLNPPVAALSGMLGLVLVGLCVVTGRRLTRFRSLVMGTAAIGLALMALTAVQAALLWPSLRAGVVVAREAPVRVAPVPMGESLFVLREAETVTLTAVHDDYVLIKTDAGKAGWVLGIHLARVVPAEQ